MRNRQARFVGFALAFLMAASSVLLAGTSAQAQGNGSGTYTVLEVVDLNIPFTDAYLSPDGAKVAWLQRTNALCVTTIATPDAPPVCGNLNAREIRVDTNSIRWSPDSSRLVLTENFLRFFYDSDIWVMDAATGDLKNLTNDGIGRLRLNGGFTVISVDLAPTWSADSKQILFVRVSEIADVIRSSFFTVDAQTGELKQQGMLGISNIATYALDWSPNGNRVLFNIASQRREEAINGLWAADLNGTNGVQMTADFGLVDVQYSADGRYALGFNGYLRGQFDTRWETSTSVLADAEKGLRLNLDPARGVHWATFAPEGNDILYVARDYRRPGANGLYIASEPGQQGYQILEGEFVPPYASAQWRTFDWATNNTILVLDMGEGRRFRLIRLGVGL